MVPLLAAVFFLASAISLHFHLYGWASFFWFVCLNLNGYLPSMREMKRANEYKKNNPSETIKSSLKQKISQLIIFVVFLGISVGVGKAIECSLFLEVPMIAWVTWIVYSDTRDNWELE